MRTVKLLSLLAAVVMISFMSCQKDYPPIPTNYCDTLVIHDTIRIHDTVAPIPLTKTQILAQKDWIADEISQNISGTNSHYVRNGINTTGTVYTNVLFHFNTNGTGTYKDENAVTHSVNWSFTSSDQTNMQLIIGAPFPTTFNWNMVELKNNFLYNTTMQGTNILLTARFIQVP